MFHKKFKLLFLIGASFTAGWAMYGLIFNPYIDTRAILEQTVLRRDPAVKFITYVDYIGREFNPKMVTIKKGNYIAITSKSKTELMWLVSDYPGLNTARGYGDGEQLQLTLLKEGNYKVVSKYNPAVVLLVTVSP